MFLELAFHVRDCFPFFKTCISCSSPYGSSFLTTFFGGIIMNTGCCTAACGARRDKQSAFRCISLFYMGLCIDKIKVHLLTLEHKFRDSRRVVRALWSVCSSNGLSIKYTRNFSTAQIAVGNSPLGAAYSFSVFEVLQDA